MHASYDFEVVRGEDRSTPVTLWCRNPKTGFREDIRLADYEFLMVIEDVRSGEQLAKLSTENGSIVLGRMVDREFVESNEDATTLLVNISQETTLQFDSSKVIYDLFLISGDIRQCLMVGTIRVLEGARTPGQVKVMRHGRAVRIPRQAPLVVEIGVRGMPGGQGEKGESLKYEDLTPEQKAELKGDKGDRGDDAEVVSIDVAVIENLF